MKKLKLLSLTLGLSALIYSCSKTGPTGPAGTNGANGTNGAAGATGPTGNANVSDTVISLTAASWTASTNYDYDVIAIPSITSAKLANGEYLIYWSANGGVQWDPLPFTTLNPAGYTFIFYVNPGNLGLYFGPAANPNTIFSAATLEFRLVYIQNGIIRQHPNTNWKDLSQVNAVLAQQNGLKN